jgi:hypothetical protein
VGRIAILSGCLLAAAVMFEAPQAKAQCIGWGLPYAQLYDVDYIPYFAKHPPVYYSRPVARTYGYSPWAYPPTVMTPELMVVNPYVPQSTRTGARADQVSKGPKTIVNPFVESKVALVQHEQLP